MRASWRQFFRRVFSVCCVGCVTTASSAMCYAVQLAFDSASDPVYADGWVGEVTNTTPMVSPGDNGGFGFTPWNFDNDNVWTPPTMGIHSMDGPPTAADPTRTQSPWNHVGTSWRLGLNYAEPGAPEGWKDIVRAGRGLASPLQIGQTLSIVVDPPSELVYYQIEAIRLNSGGSNICPGCDPNAETRFALDFFNFTDQNDWGRWSATSIGATPLFNKDKVPFEHPDFPMGAAGTDRGVRIDFTLTGAETFEITLTPLDEPTKAFTGSGTLENPGGGPIDWIEFMHWRLETPQPDPNAFDTDFFIRSLEITSDAPVQTADFDDDGDIDGADFLTWQRGVGKANPALADGDADDDNDVDAADLAVWKQQFGTAAGAAALTAAVPEPASLCGAAIALGGLGAAALAGRRGRRARRSIEG